jgi:uncharacterized coiled-coil DUF342 family protein
MTLKTRHEYIQFLHRKIDEWNLEIDKLVSLKDQIEEDSKTELNAQIDSLTQKRTEIEQQLQEITATSADAWDDMKSGIDLAWEAMNTAVKSAVSRFIN